MKNYTKALAEQIVAVMDSGLMLEYNSIEWRKRV